MDQKENIKKANDELKRLQHEEKLKELEQEKKIGEYAAKKDAME